MPAGQSTAVDFVWIAIGCTLVGVLAGALATWLIGRQRRRVRSNPIGDERALMRTLIDLMPDYIYAKDAAGRFALANQAVAQVMGAGSPDKLIGKTDADFYSPEMAAKFRADEQIVLESGVPLRDREELGTDQEAGEARWHLTTKVPVFGRHGEVIGLVGITRDIHRRKQAEEEIRNLNAELDQRVKERTAELAAERNLLRTLIDNMPDLIYAKDRESRYILANNAAAAGVGATPDALLGRTVFDYYPSEQAQSFVDDERRVMATGEALIGREEPALERTTGAQRWLLTTKVPLRDDAGQIVGIVGISRNIGELRRIREELTQHRDRLQQLVDERTAELKVAKERAEAANAAKSRFLANMSHELRTPLNAVLGYAQILRREPTLTPAQAAGLDTIRRSGEQLLTLINSVLDLARIEAGKVEVFPDAVSLHALMRNVTDIIRLNAQDKGLQFRLETSPDLQDTVNVDGKRLVQVLLNLLGNAVKFTEHGQVTLRLRRLPAEGDRVRLRFSVVDTGIGIGADHMSTIFLPFEQAADVQRRYGGTGLGLAISRQLVGLMGSDIHVESQPGKGSHFWFDLDVTPMQTQAPAVVAPHMPAITGYRGRRRRILVVDDVAANRQTVVDFLGPLGFELQQAENGEQGLRGARAGQPDLILMDSVMPELDGLEAIRRLRRWPALNDVPVISVSASASAADQQESLAVGANVFLSKPIDLDQLLAEIGRLLQLEWVAEARDEEAFPGADMAMATATPMVAPPAEEMAALVRLAQLGNMRNIRRQADHLATLDAAYAPFAQRLRQLAEGYQSKAILELVRTVQAQQSKA